MKKVNLLSKAEMKKVLGGNEPLDCLKECTYAQAETSAKCSDGVKVCTYFLLQANVRQASNFVFKKSTYWMDYGPSNIISTFNTQK